MRTLLLFLPLFFTTALNAAAPTGPVRVAYAALDKPDRQGAQRCAVLMRELGRDAIWFDFEAMTDVKPMGDRLTSYDVILADGVNLGGHRLSSAAITPEFPADLKALDAEAVSRIKTTILQALSSERLSNYQVFLAHREPEKREAHPQVANYEKRPAPLTFQQPFSVQGSMERTQVPADLELKLFAAEPDIHKPIAFTWDDRGRCWVCETADYPHGIVEDGMGHDSIKICEDTDGDGKADKFTVFADKLNIPTGIVFANGGIIVSQPPRFLFLKDTDGDDKADMRQDIITGYGIRDTHAQASNLHYGLDNWIYGCVGYSGFDGMVGGQKVTFTMGTYRLKADGSALEFLHQFTNNAWAHSTNAAGDQFGGTANGAPLFFGGIPATAAPPGLRIMTAKKINEVDQCHPITPHFRQVDVFGGYTSAAGSAFIESAALPQRLQGMAMVCEPTLKLISLMDVRDEGSGYTAKDGFNLVASTDEWMSPVFAEVGPDGAIWFADWQNFIIQHNPTPSVERGGFNAKTGVGGAHENDLRDHARGRIYRVVAKGTQPRVKTPAIDGDTQWSRLTAQRLLVDGKKLDQVETLKKSVIANTGSLGSVHALWTLHGLGQLDEATHKAALLSKDPVLRRNAIRALGSDAKAEALLFGSGTATDADLHTRLAALVKLADFSTTPELRTLINGLTAQPEVQKDEWLREAARLLAKKNGTTAFKEGPNLLANAGLEKVGADNLPESWQRRDYGGTAKASGNTGAQWSVVHEGGQTHSGTSAVRCITRADADTSLYQDVPLKPNTMYKISGWIKTHAFKGRASLNDHLGRAETEKNTARESDWNEVEVVFTNKDRPTASINILHVGKGDSYFDDLKLCELIPTAEEDKALTGDVKRGEEIFWKHPIAACMNCHVLQGKGSAVGPALDGIAARKDEAYLTESLVNPNAKIAEGYTATPISPMPPMKLILKPQEFEDVRTFILSLK